MAEEKVPELTEKQKRAPKSPSKYVPVNDDAIRAYLSTRSAMDGGIPEAGTDRWAWANNIISEGLKINLINFGYMSNPEIPESGVEVIIPEQAPHEDRYITYKIGLPRRALKRYLRFRSRSKWLLQRKWVVWQWLLVKLMDRYEKYDVERNIRRNVREYLGTDVVVLVKVSRWK